MLLSAIFVLNKLYKLLSGIIEKDTLHYIFELVQSAIELMTLLFEGTFT